MGKRGAVLNEEDRAGVAICAAASPSVLYYMLAGRIRTRALRKSQFSSPPRTTELAIKRSSGCGFFFLFVCFGFLYRRHLVWGSKFCTFNSGASAPVRRVCIMAPKPTLIFFASEEAKEGKCLRGSQVGSVSHPLLRGCTVGV